jgi:hypothetical protein
MVSQPKLFPQSVFLLFNRHADTLLAVKRLALLDKQVQTGGKLNLFLSTCAFAGKSKFPQKTIRLRVYAPCLFPVQFKAEQQFLRGFIRRGQASEGSKLRRFRVFKRGAKVQVY